MVFGLERVTPTRPQKNYLKRFCVLSNGAFCRFLTKGILRGKRPKFITKGKKMKKSIVSIALIIVAMFGVSSAQATGEGEYHSGYHNPHNTPPVVPSPTITGSVAGVANGGAFAGGTGPNLQTLTESMAWTTGSVFSQNLGKNSGWNVSAGFDNLAQAINGGAGPSSAVTTAFGNAKITVVPPSMPVPMSMPHYDGHN